MPQVRREANVLYEIPLPFTIRGRTTFAGDLLRSSPIDVSANFFSKDPWTISFGVGQVTMAYQPVPFEGTLAPERVLVAMGFGADIATLGGTHPCCARPHAATRPPTAASSRRTACPTSRCWTCAPASGSSSPTCPAGQIYELENAARWVNPTSGQVQVQFVNQRQDGIGFQFQVQITGTVK